MKITKSKSGLPCLWESGGGMSNTGTAILVAAPDGSPKRPIYIRRSGSLACDDHALIPIRGGDLVIMANHHRGDFNITINKIIGINLEEDEAELEEINQFSMGEWDDELPEKLKAAIEAAKDKATDYHCRIPYWIQKAL